MNVVRSVRFILDTVTEASSSTPQPLTDGHSVDRPSNVIVSPELLKLRMRLLPLQHVEESLLRKMTPAGSSEFEPTHLSPVKKKTGKFRELAINSTTQWKGAFGRLIATARASFEGATEVDLEAPNDAGVILHACSEDIIKLWNDPTIKMLLKAKRIRLEDMGGLCVIQTFVALTTLTEISFLDSIERVTALRYVPTDGKSACFSRAFYLQIGSDDILRARLKTLGISEHRFTLDAGLLFFKLSFGVFYMTIF